MNIVRNTQLIQRTINKININYIKKKQLFRKIQSKFYCSHCNGKGYIVCNKCFNGCYECSNEKYYPCLYCSGIGFSGYTYF